MAPSEEQQFFYRLAGDDNLRAEYKCFNRISEASSYSALASAPSATLTEAIFANLGIASSPTTALPIPVVQSGTGLIAKTSVIASAVTAILMLAFLWFAGVFDTEIKYITKNLNDTDKQQNQKSDVQNEISYNSLNSAIHPTIYQIKKTATLNKLIEQNVDEEVTIATNTEIPNQTLTLEETISPSQLRYNVPNFVSYRHGRANYSLLPQVELNKYTKNSFIGFELKLNNRTAINLPKEEIAPQSYSPFHNSSVSLEVPLSSNFSSGLDIEQGTFYCEYEGTDSNGDLYLYKQQPNLTTFSAFLKYKFPLDYLSPNVSLGTGFNKSGLVLLGEIGANVPVSDKIEFNCGLRYNYFNYRHQNERFWTSKISFGYGLLLKF